MLYLIERTPYGIRVAFDGMMSEEIAKQFRSEFLQLLDSTPGEISILIDLRKGHPISVESQAIVNDCYHAVIRRGLTRSANLVASAMMKMQMVRRAKELGTFDKVRYIDASADCERLALDWLEKGIDPDMPLDTTPRVRTQEAG